MTIETQKAWGQVSSIKTSVANAIVHLSKLSIDLSKAGRHDQADAVERERNLIAQAAGAIADVEAELRAQRSLSGGIAALSAIAKDAKDTAARIRKTGTVLAETAKLTEILTRLPALVV